MFRFKLSLCLSIFLSLSLATAASAEESSSGSGTKDFIQRAERRESKRWTLKEWLEQKDRNRMMDMWLSMNAPSPFELVLGGSYNSFQTETLSGGVTNSFTSYQGSLSAYAQFVGLTAEHENNTQEGINDLSGLFNLRLVGHTIQGSYLAVHYGQRTRNITANQVRLNQQFAQGSIQLYLTKYFGFDGLYRYYIPTNELTLGDISGNLSEGGAFIDFKNFRIFGAWYKETTIYNNSGVETNTNRAGIKTGLKIFF